MFTFWCPSYSVKNDGMFEGFLEGFLDGFKPRVIFYDAKYISSSISNYFQGQGTKKPR